MIGFGALKWVTNGGYELERSRVEYQLAYKLYKKKFATTTLIVTGVRLSILIFDIF